MSKIALLARGEIPKRMVVELRRLTGVSMVEIRACVREARPFHEARLFGNDHVEVAGRLQEVLELCSSAGIELEIFELEPDEPWDSAPLEACRLDVSALKNILDAAAQRFA